MCAERHQAEHKSKNSILAAQSLSSFGVFDVAEVCNFVQSHHSILRAIHCIQLFLELLVGLALEKVLELSDAKKQANSKLGTAYNLSLDVNMLFSHWTFLFCSSLLF